jgi:hypothetical protein
MTDKPTPAPPAKKRHIAVTILLVLWTIIRTVFVLYAVIFSITATILIYWGYNKGYAYVNEYVLTPLNEVKRLKKDNESLRHNTDIEYPKDD